MKFTPRALDDNVNVSRTHPLKEFFWLVGALFLIAGAIFLALSLLTDLVVAKTPFRVEKWLGQKALQRLAVTKDMHLDQCLAGLLQSLPAESRMPHYSFQVFRADIKEVNAIALPGGNIIVFSGLLEQVQSENELAMILAHELAHFANRDHLRGLGRGLGVVVAATLLFGQESAVSNVAVKTMLSFQARYSQAQETAADLFGLKLLNLRYGHVGGGTDFFRRIAENAGGKIPYVLASHPHPAARIAALETLIDENKFAIARTEPLPVE